MKTHPFMLPIILLSLGAMALSQSGATPGAPSDAMHARLNLQRTQ